MKTHLFLIYCIAFIWCTIGCSVSYPIGYISKNTVNLRAEPRKAAPSFAYDTLQNSQLLLGDRVQVIRKVNDNWFEVRALDQARFSNQTWHPYDGYVETNEVWIQNEHLKQLDLGKCPHANDNIAQSNSVINAANKSYFAIVQSKRAEIFDRLCEDPGCLKPVMEVSMGTIFRHVDNSKTPWGWIEVGTEDKGHIWYIRHSDVMVQDSLHDKGEYPFVLKTKEEELKLRESIVESSFKLVGGVYFWGGRSSYSWREFTAPVDGAEKVISGVDCSGLVGLSYQTSGYILPRDAHDMYLRSERFDLSEGQPGDLFFYYKPSADRVTHVMMMVDRTHIIESTSGVNASLSVTMETRFNRKYEDLEYGQEVGSYHLYWGRFLKSM